jgi:hypothetical protein
MKMFALAAGLAALAFIGSAQAAPLPAQAGITAPEGGVTQVRDRMEGHGGMRGMRHGRGMSGMRHGGSMRGMRHGGGMRNMRGMNYGNM